MRQNETPYFWHMHNLVQEELFHMSQELDHLDNRLYKTESKRVNNLYVAVVSDSDEYDKDNQPNTVYIIHTNDKPIFRFGHWLPSNTIIRLQRMVNIKRFRLFNVTGGQQVLFAPCLGVWISLVHDWELQYGCFDENEPYWDSIVTYNNPNQDGSKCLVDTIPLRMWLQDGAK
jgi:hypothetical protein